VIAGTGCTLENATLTACLTKNKKDWRQCQVFLTFDLEIKRILSCMPKISMKKTLLIGLINCSLQADYL